MKPLNKTNALRILDKLKIPYEVTTYECEEFTDGLEVALTLGISPDLCFKTLVTTGKSGVHYVFVIPVNKDLDLKKAASASGEKYIELLPLKDLEPLTGYIRGGCTAIGMKHRFPVFLDLSAQDLSKIYISGGRRGLQVDLEPNLFLSAVQGAYSDLCQQ